MARYSSIDRQTRPPVSSEAAAPTPENRGKYQKENLLRHLSEMEPTEDVPWSIDVISAVPKDIMTQMSHHSSSTNGGGLCTNFVTGCTVGRWSCAVVDVSDISKHEPNITDVFVKKYQLYIWYVYPNQSLSNQKSKAPYQILHHDNELNTSFDGNSSFSPSAPLVAMTVAENPFGTVSPSTCTNNRTLLGAGGTTTIHNNCVSSVYVYAANPDSGVLLLWKVSLNDLQQQNQQQTCSDIVGEYPTLTFSSHSFLQQQRQQPVPFPLHPFGHKCVVFVEGSDDKNSNTTKNNAILTCMHVSWANPVAAGANYMKGSPCIIIGSSHGHIYWITQTHVPTSLHVQDVAVADAINPSPGGGILSLFFTPSKKKMRLTDAVGGSYGNAGHNIVRVQLLPNASSTILHNQSPMYYFLSASFTGQLIVWKVTATESSYLSLIEVDTVQDLTCHSLANYYEKFEVLNTPAGLAALPPLSSSALLIQDAVAKLADTTATPSQNKEESTILLTVVGAVPIKYNDQEERIRDSRFYWIQMRFFLSSNNDWTIEVVHVEWLNRFLHPIERNCLLGLTISDNDIAYAIFGCKDNSTSELRISASTNQVVMALSFPASFNQTKQFEEKRTALPSLLLQLELNSQVLLPNTCSPDVVTHGISALDETGVGIRIRCLPLKEKRMTELTYTTITDSLGIREHFINRNQHGLVTTLIHHLYSAHWQSYIHPDQVVLLPPVIVTQIGTEELEQAVIEYSKKSMISSSSVSSNDDVKMKETVLQIMVPNSNVLEWNLTFIRLLHQSGIYRTFSEVCKWNLLKVGQELRAYEALLNCDTTTSYDHAWKQEQLSDLRSDDVAQWLRDVQMTIGLVEGSGEDRQSVWLGWLCTALESAMTFREETAMSYYDVSPNQPPIIQSKEEDVPIWTSHDTIQLVLSTQLDYWRSSSTGRSYARVEQIETIVQDSLFSFCDSYGSQPALESARRGYVECKHIAISILRQVKDVRDDRVAFALSRAHNYFDGLCQIAFDHERRSDRDLFSLQPLFAQLSMVNDISSGYSFGKHVLLWHIERKLFGHVLHYGKECPNIMDELIDTVEEMRQYRWISAVRKRSYHSASKYLVDNTLDPDSTVAIARTSISIACLCLSAAEKQDSIPNIRNDSFSGLRRLIEKKRELINAQEELLGEGRSYSSTLLQTKDLLDLAFTKFRNCQDKDSRIHLGVISLAICTGFDDHDQSKLDAVCFVWYETICADKELWEEWLRTVTDYQNNTNFREIVLRTTIFGGLFQRCQETEGWDDVSYSDTVEEAIFVKLSSRSVQQSLFTPKLQRLLRSVIATLK